MFALFIKHDMNPDHKVLAQKNEKQKQIKNFMIYFK